MNSERIEYGRNGISAIYVWYPTLEGINIEPYMNPKPKKRVDFRIGPWGIHIFLYSKGKYSTYNIRPNQLDNLGQLHIFLEEIRISKRYITGLTFGIENFFHKTMNQITFDQIPIMCDFCNQLRRKYFGIHEQPVQLKNGLSVLL